jgi:hypothetical protein
MLPVTIYCYEINFIVTSKSRALMKQLIVMDQLWHLVRYYSAMTRPDWPVTCANDIDCDDGLWCNGKLCYLGHI